MAKVRDDKSTYNMLYLVSCILNESVPDKEKILSMNLENLFEMCQFHSLTAMVCIALESAGTELPGYWIEAKLKAIRKVMLLDSERQKILQFMEENGIWYMPLKGVILKELYPKIGMRQMSDNDILYDKTYQKEVCDYMKQQGYTAETVGKTHHDEYQKPPVFNFEMHTILFGEENDEKIIQYYSDFKDKLLKDDNKNYAYHLSDENFYIFITVHEYKHFNIGGTGLRSLIDRFIYIKSKQNTLDWKYIEGELQKLGISEFEQKARQLCLTVFSGCDLPELSDDENELLKYYLYSGTYGTLENTVKNRMEKIHNETGSCSKFKYIWNRFFPPMKFYKMHYPFFYKHKLLLPFAWIYRIFRGLIFNNKKLHNELNSIKNYQK